MAGMPDDIAYWLDRKYSILGQQANADTLRAGAAVTSANAGANLDSVRATLLPQDSAAQNALVRAQTALTGNQAQTVLPESAARIRNVNAQTKLTGAQTNLTGAQVGQTTANTALIGQQTVGAALDNRVYTIPNSLRGIMGVNLPALGQP